MSTALQQNLAHEIVKNTKRKKPLNKKELLVSVGYATNTAEVKAKEIIEQKGVQEELKRLGFDPENAKRVVGEILDGEDLEPKDRLKAAEMVFKVHGSFAAEKTANLNLNVNAEMSTDFEPEELVREAELLLKSKKL